MLDPDASRIRDRILSIVAAGARSALSDAEFDELSLRIFAFQHRHNRIYAGYCDRRGLDPSTVRTWGQVPAVPSAAFKEVPLFCAPLADAVRTFRTSGTTRGGARRGEHHFLDLGVYDAVGIAIFRDYVLPDRDAMRMLSLVPAEEDARDSSLSYMVSRILHHLGAPGSDTFVSTARGIDFERTIEALRRSEREREPVCILGTSLAFVHLLDAMERVGVAVELPPGSRLMDTGGFKGLRREVLPGELRARYARALGIPPGNCVNEYGMTELTSQFYDDVLHAHRDQEPRTKGCVAWTRTTAVDPESLLPLPDGEVGLLRHHDLANLFSIQAVQTEDIGYTRDGGFVVLGRVAGAAPRGCSIAMDALLQSAGREP